MFAGFIRRVKAWWDSCVRWLDGHPRTGWYIAAMVTVNVALNVLDLLH